ncbi:hypothetical protein D083_0342 [Dickeya solani RNS 08.23.3.1.A]|nr:hypothetical protein D083_0342 [Dickeya solani RNS 08.23.3.1.A]
MRLPGLNTVSRDDRLEKPHSGLPIVALNRQDRLGTTELR